MTLYQGLWVALITPFKNGQIDEKALQLLVEDLSVRGVRGFIPLGTTGEASTLSNEERKLVIKLCLEAAGDVSVVPGCGTNNTAQTIERVNEAAAMGASGAMVITPYYSKPTQEGLLAHFRAVADSTDLPLMLYNVPGRTGVNMLPETVERLAEHPNIDGLKEASGNLDQIGEICKRVAGQMNVLSGDDGLTLPILSVGGEGLVSVVAHVAPEPFAEMIDTFWNDNPQRALDLHRRVLPLCKTLFLETSPAPVKCALWSLGKIQNELRLPLVPVKPDTRDKVIQAVKDYHQAVQDAEN
jgi:4-hydroxy-tetrahydrodipicolinate synthase